MKEITYQTVDPDGTICFRIEEVPLTAEEREQKRRHEEGRERNEAWLRSQWPRLIPACLGNWLAVGGQEAFVAATQEEALAWVRANHANDLGAFVDRIDPYWTALYEGTLAPVAEDPRVRIEYLGHNEERRRMYLGPEYLRRNEEWLAAQWPWLLPTAMGNYVGVCDRQAIILGTREEAVAWREARLGDDPGTLIKNVDPFRTHRTYPNDAYPW